MDFEWPARAQDVEREVAEFLAANLPPELDDRLYRDGESHDPGFARALAERDWIAPGHDSEPQRKALQQDRHQVRNQDDGQQGVAKA